jgi:RNA polymerase sigma factor (sigma-70 family)
MFVSKNDDGFSLEQQDRAALLNKSMKTLSPEKRVALVLFEVEGLTLNEISEILKIPLQTVWSRVYNGRKELFNKLSGNLSR